MPRLVRFPDVDDPNYEAVMIGFSRVLGSAQRVISNVLESEYPTTDPFAHQSDEVSYAQDMLIQTACDLADAYRTKPKKEKLK